MTDSIHPQGSLAFLPQMERGIGSLYAALDTLILTERFETALSLAGSLYPYWETYENLSDGIEWLLKLAGPQADDRFSQASLSRLYAMVGNLLRHQSEYERAIAYYEHALVCLNGQPDPQVHTFILGGLGEVAFRQGRYEAARGLYQSYMEIGRQTGDVRYVANAFNALGRLATVKADFAEALEYHHEGRYLCEAHQYPTGLAWMFNALGELDRARGEYAKATQHFQESAAIFQRLGNLGAEMLALQNLAFALSHKNPSRSEKLFRQTLSFWLRGPARHGLSLSLIGLSRVDLARGNLKKALRQIAAASQILDQIGVKLELGDRVDYEIALERLTKKTGRHPLSTEEFGRLHNLPRVSRSNLSKGLSLTERETTVLRLAAQGLTDKQIAAQLVISAHTVNAHLKSIYRKLSVSNRMSAVAAAKSRRIF